MISPGHTKPASLNNRITAKIPPGCQLYRPNITPTVRLTRKNHSLGILRQSKQEPSGRKVRRSSEGSPQIHLTKPHLQAGLKYSSQRPTQGTTLVSTPVTARHTHWKRGYKTTMANQQVGMVYDRVIQEVCEASRVDFEEGGVDQQTLEEMKISWQQKLSSLGVAHFPWDPPLKQSPPPVQPPNPILPPPTTVPSNVPRHTHPPAQASSTLPPQAPVSDNLSSAPNIPVPVIKTEPGINGQNTGAAPSGLLDAQALARERAMNNMHSKYGAAAANSVSQLQAQSQAALSLPGQQRPPNGVSVAQDAIKPLQQQPYPGVAPPQRAPYQPPQTDGANDALAEWKAEVARRREYSKRQNGEGDRLLMTQLRLDALRLEGGGLMLPLDEHPSLTLPRRVSSVQNTSSAQTDGPAEDEDEDAINSDLDDPDDLVTEDPEGDETAGQLMLCTYDKVQRVKNKWKCTLKDGILSTGGKEYVFHKGQGEFEW